MQLLMWFMTESLTQQDLYETSGSRKSGKGVMSLAHILTWDKNNNPLKNKPGYYVKCFTRTIKKNPNHHQLYVTVSIILFNP